MGTHYKLEQHGALIKMNDKLNKTYTERDLFELRYLNNIDECDSIVSPYEGNRVNSWIKKIPKPTTVPLIISADERKEIEDYFDTYLAAAYDVTENELVELREIYVCTFKSMVGDKTFTEWLAAVTPKIKPWFGTLNNNYYFSNSDKEGFGHGK